MESQCLQCIAAITNLDSAMHRLSDNIDRLVSQIEGLQHDLIPPATGRRQVPLLTHLIIVLSLSVALLVSHLAEKNRDFTLDWDGGLDLKQSPNHDY